jgi:N-acetylmuramoyl-L-alanine amidase
MIMMMFTLIESQYLGYKIWFEYQKNAHSLKKSYLKQIHIAIIRDTDITDELYETFFINLNKELRWNFQ